MKYVIGFILLALGAYYIVPLFTATDQVIKDVVMFTDNGKAVVQVHFSGPIRYENHFPDGNSNFLQVKFHLVSLQRHAHREVVPQDLIKTEVVQRTSLMNISYEGDVPGGPFLTFLFTRPVDFSVKPSESLDSIIVEIPLAGSESANQATKTG